VGADAGGQKLAFQTLGEFAGFRGASVVDEAAPSNVVSDDEVTL